MVSIAITGVCSPIGKLLVQKFSSRVDVTSIKGLDIIPYNGHFSSKFEFIQGDIRNNVKLKLLIKDIDILYHFAFIVYPKKIDKEFIYDVNIEGSKKVFIEVSKENVAKVIYISSIAAYGSPEGMDPVITEENPIKGADFPEFYYYYSKGKVEEFLNDFEKKHPEISFIRLRPHVIAGKNYFKAYHDMLYGDLLDAKENSKRVPVIKAENSTVPLVQFTHEEDLLDILVYASNNSLRGGYNIAGKPVNLLEYCEKHGIKVRLIAAPGLLWKIEKIYYWLSSKIIPSNRITYIWFKKYQRRMIMKSIRLQNTGYSKHLRSTEECLDELFGF